MDPDPGGVHGPRPSNRHETGVTRSADAVTRDGVSTPIRRFSRLPSVESCAHARKSASQAAIIRRSVAAARRDSRAYSRMKTYVAKPSNRQRDWLLVDASGKTLGPARDPDRRHAARQAQARVHAAHRHRRLRRGRERREDRTSPATSGRRRCTATTPAIPAGCGHARSNDMLERRPEEVIRIAVKGMLPRNRLARQQLRKLKVYAGPDHPHEAQQPKPVEDGESLNEREEQQPGRAAEEHRRAARGGRDAGGRRPEAAGGRSRGSAGGRLPRRRRPRRRAAERRGARRRRGTSARRGARSAEAAGGRRQRSRPPRSRAARRWPSLPPTRATPRPASARARSRG